VGAASQTQYEETNDLTFSSFSSRFFTLEPGCIIESTFDATKSIPSSHRRCSRYIAEDFSTLRTSESIAKMLFPREKGQDDVLSTTEYKTTKTYYDAIETEIVGAQPTYMAPAAQSYPTTPPFSSIPDSQADDGDDGPFDGMRHGAKAGVIAIMLLGILAIVLVSIWFCCGGKSRWARRKAAREGAPLPLHTISNQPQEQSRGPPQPAAQTASDQPASDQYARGQPTGYQRGGELPPPSYEEAVPAQHQRLAGGLPTRDDEEDGMVVDGKTPLSEIPFEDVVLDHSPSGSSSSANSANQSFSARHHNQHGDTSGHTNS